MNVLVALDRKGNVYSGESANEAVSQRTARACGAGQRWAFVVCDLLTAASRLFGATGDYCT